VITNSALYSVQRHGFDPGPTAENLGTRRCIDDGVDWRAPHDVLGRAARNVRLGWARGPRLCCFPTAYICGCVSAGPEEFGQVFWRRCTKRRSAIHSHELASAPSCPPSRPLCLWRQLLHCSSERVTCRLPSLRCPRLSTVHKAPLPGAQ